MSPMRHAEASCILIVNVNISLRVLTSRFVPIPRFPKRFRPMDFRRRHLQLAGFEAMLSCMVEFNHQP